MYMRTHELDRFSRISMKIEGLEENPMLGTRGSRLVYVGYVLGDWGLGAGDGGGGLGIMG